MKSVWEERIQDIGDHCEDFWLPQAPAARFGIVRYCEVEKKKKKKPKEEHSTFLSLHTSAEPSLYRIPFECFTC